MSTILNLVELREGGTQDLSAVGSIMHDAFDARFGEAWTRGQCMGVLAMPGVRLLLAFVDDRPAGFAMVRQVLGVCGYTLGVVPPVPPKPAAEPGE